MTRSADRRDTPLHWAALRDEEPEFLETLLGAGSDPNARNGPGQTPLHWAATYNDSEVIVASLLDAGADPMLRDLLGNSPLHEAARYTTNPIVLEMLLDAGADPLAEGHRGYTAVEMARSNSDSDIARLLQIAAATAAEQVE